MLIKKTINYLKTNGLIPTFVKIAEYRKYKSAAIKYVADHPISDEEIEVQKATVYDKKTVISLVTPAYNTDKKFLDELLQSVLAQTYPYWELVIADASDSDNSCVFETINAIEDSRIVYKKLAKNGGISNNTNEGIALASGEYIGLLDHDDLISPTALFEFKKAIDKNADFIYCDELSFVDSPKKPKVIHLKPDFAIDNLRGNNYICHLSVFKKSLLETVGNLRCQYDGSQDHDLVLRLTEKAENIVHISKVLYYWRIHSTSVASDISAKPYCITSGIKAVNDQLKRLNISGSAESTANAPSAYRLTYNIKKMPSIAIISRTNNYHTEKSTAEYLAFVDNGIQPLGDNWQKELVMLLRRNDVGIAGGKILKGKKILSGGILLSPQCYKYAYNNIHNSSTGYMKKLKYIQNVSALPTGFFMIKKSLFDEIGGFNEKLWGDERIIDLCLRLRQKGLLVVFNPYAEAVLDGKRRKPTAYSHTFLSIWSDSLECEDKYFSTNYVKYIF